MAHAYYKRPFTLKIHSTYSGTWIKSTRSILDIITWCSLFLVQIVSDCRRMSDLQWFWKEYPQQCVSVRVEASEKTRAQRGWRYTAGRRKNCYWLWNSIWGGWGGVYSATFWKLTKIPVLVTFCSSLLTFVLQRFNILSHIYTPPHTLWYIYTASHTPLYMYTPAYIDTPSHMSYPSYYPRYTVWFIIL